MLPSNLGSTLNSLAHISSMRRLVKKWLRESSNSRSIDNILVPVLKLPFYPISALRLEILSSEYQLYACGIIFRRASTLNKMLSFRIETILIFSPWRYIDIPMEEKQLFNTTTNSGYGTLLVDKQPAPS